MKANDRHQARLMLPMETHAQPQVAHPMSPSMCRRHCGVLARKREGVSGAEQMRALLLMPLLARSAGKPTRKLTVQVSPRGGQIGIASKVSIWRLSSTTVLRANFQVLSSYLTWSR